MKTPFLIVFAVIIAFAAVPTAAEDIDPRAQRLAERLSLDDEQTREISDLLVEHRENMRARMESGEQPRGRAWRNQQRESHTIMQERIRAALTPEQAETFDQLGPRARHSAERRGGDRKGMHEREGGMPEGQLPMSNLDPSKRDELRALRERQRGEMQALRVRHRQERQALMDDANGKDVAAEPVKDNSSDAEEDRGEPGDG